MCRWQRVERQRLQNIVVLDHNRHDVLGMTQLVQKALDGLAPAGRLPNH
jgi:hypothetical protein